MLNYLKITGHPVGLILNFKRSRREWKRVINDSNPKNSNHNRSAAEMAGQKASNHSVK